MAGIIPIPTSRISGLLTRQRLTQQYQTDQLDLFRLQEQISTGYRISLPSEDAPAAVRAISLQRLLNRKGQLETNIKSGLKYLASTDDAVNDVAHKLSEIKATTLGVVGTIETQEQRNAAISQIDNALKSLVDLGNRKVQGRYIFGGTQASQPPYSEDRYGNIVYHGDDRSLRSYSDLGVLFASNTTGQEVFGGISDFVLGSSDLNPQLSADTLLSSLRGGRGINPNGSLQIANTTTNELSIVDISTASTVGDVARLIEDNAPTGSKVDVSITGSGLTIELDSGTLVVSEVGTGTTARELGLLNDQTPALAGTVSGEDLNPEILKTTLVDDLLGTKARTTLRSGGDNNDILIEAGVNGAALEGVTIVVEDSTDIGATASASYDAFAKTLTISIDDTGDTSANHVVDAINAEGTFRAELDLVDSSSTADAGTGQVAAGVSTELTSGGSGETLDKTSGIRVVTGGNTYDITFEDAETVEDLLNTLNGAEAGLLAEINATGDGINIRSRLNGSDFQIGEINGGTTATQLGVRTYTEDSRLSDFNYGVGIPTRDPLETNITQSSLEITASDGSAFNVDLTAVADLAGAIGAINTAATTAGIAVTAQLDPENNSVLQLVDGNEGDQRASIAQSGADLAINGGIDFSIHSPDLSITASTGDSFTIDVSGAETVQEVLDLINTDAGNAGLITARLAQSGNGIELVDTNGGSLTVASLGGSQAAEYLGFVVDSDTPNTSVSDTLYGADRNYLENDSVFTTLIRLRDALAENNLPAIERAAARIDADISRATFAQADVGSRLQNLDLTQQNLQDEVIQLRSALSEEIDVDLVQAISDLTARQISLEASLRATANILQLSLLNFI